MSETEVTLSEDEYVRAQRLFGRLTVRLKVIYLVAAALLAGVAVISSGQVRFTALCALVGGIVGHFWFTRVLIPRRSRKTYRNYPLVQRPFTARSDIEGISFKSEAGAVRLKWGDIHKWRENDEFVLVYPAPNLFHVLPKRLENFDTHSLTSALNAHVGSAT